MNTQTNQLTYASYDFNGNMTSGAGASYTYDEKNRIINAQVTGGGKEYYGCDASNRRVYRVTGTGQEQLISYGLNGEKLGTSSIQENGTCNWGYYYSGYGFPCMSGQTAVNTSVSFAGRLIMDSGNAVVQDRVGTNRTSGARFYPYGDEITSTSNDREKFATYTRDSYTGLDYADQRFYASTYGRFNTADPAGIHAVKLKNPGTWNQYAYTTGDPVNLNDPLGFDGEGPSYCDIYGPIDPHCNPNYCPPGVCDADGDPGSGAPTCAQFTQSMSWTGEQFFDASVIAADASSLGVMLGGFKLASGPDGMHVASGVPFSNSQTEFNLTGDSSAVGLLLGSLCRDPNNPNCFTDAGPDALHLGGTGSNFFNFRQNTATDSMQITGTWNFSTQTWQVQVDIDPNNSLKNPGLHSIDVFRNFVSGLDTDYHGVAQRLGINPSANNPWCNP